LLTVIFAIYAVALLVTLLIAGRLSDYVGRRPLIAVALLLQIISMFGFIWAENPWWLIYSRIIQGVATGLATTALGAALLDVSKTRGPLANSLAPMLGLAAGVIGSTSLLAYSAYPLQSVYVVLAIIFAILFIALAKVPESGVYRAGALHSLKPQIAVPAAARVTFWRLSLGNIAVWMIGGFNLSLMPSLMSNMTGSRSVWFGGIVVTILTGSAAVSVFFGRQYPPKKVFLTGEITLILGLSCLLVAIHFHHIVGVALASVIIGLGFGAIMSSVMSQLLPLAPPEQRAGLMGVYYLVSYLAFSIPTMAIGLVAQHWGLMQAIYIYAAIILSILSMSILMSIRQNIAQHIVKQSEV